MPAHFIREWRIYRGIKTQARLAEKIGLTAQSISRLESGSMKYRQDVLERIAEALDCTPGQLLSHAPQAAPAVASAHGTPGMAETPRAFSAPRRKVGRHPASGAMKGTFTIEPGYDLTRPAFDDDEIAEWESNLDKLADEWNASSDAGK